ncbi:DUF3857 domain-containing protein [Chishuiella sp.]|uniref:DUF3857 domain-containing protein n=1 Tax=Chishuiella sp. TaxID=1969467 RepID=UPI0028AD8E6A|nr:DUF3857 domain-containing protein [Chishuiella sp.]
MKSITTFLLFFTSLLVYSQNNDFKYGKPSENNLNYTSVPFDKNADAVILYEQGIMDLLPANYRLEVKRRIKILTEEGVKNANIRLSYYSKNKNEYISGIKGNTINNVNGEVVVTPIDSKEVFDTNINELYSAKVFTFPNVKVGSIIEYVYVKNSQLNFSIDAWNFQHDIPSLYSEFNLNNSTYGGYSIITIGDELNSKYKNKKSNNSKWILTNLNSFNDLKYVYNKEDQSERIKLQADNYHTDGVTKNTLEAWKKLINDLNNEYLSNRNGSFVKDIAKTIPDGKDEEETLRNIINYVDDNVKWNNYYSIVPKLTNRNLVNEKKGSTADLNLFLNEILLAKGFKSHLVLYSTRDHGQLRIGYPYINQFNSVMTVVELKNGLPIILDAAQLNSQQINYGPIDAFNYYGVILDKGDANFVKLAQRLSSYESVMNYQFTNNNVILNRRDGFNGYFYNGDPNDKNVLKYYLTESLEIPFDVDNETKLVYENDKYVKSYKSLSNTVKAPFYTFISPLREFLKQYTFEDKNRDRNIEFNFPYLFNINIKFKIPEGYEVVLDDKFKAHHKTDLGLEYYQDLKIKENQATIIYQFILPEGVFESSKYNKLKLFFDQIKAESNKEVLMKKKQ